VPFTHRSSISANKLRLSVCQQVKALGRVTRIYNDSQIAKEDRAWDGRLLFAKSAPGTRDPLTASVAELESVLGALVTDTVSLFYVHLLSSCSSVEWLVLISLFPHFEKQNKRRLSDHLVATLCIHLTNF
jgi:hypothetical protein